MSRLQTFREWYDLSGTDLLTELEHLDQRRFRDTLQADIARPCAGQLRTLDEIARDDRAALPTVAELQAGEPSELSLQYMFVHRRHYATPDEIIVVREPPTSPSGITREGAADLLVLDQTRKRPVVVELKRGSAGDMMSSVLLEVLSHWSFYTRHFVQFREIMNEAGWEIGAQVKHPAIGIAAPTQFLRDTARRATSHRRALDELSIAMQMIEWLQRDFHVDVSIHAIDDNWLQIGPQFGMTRWTAP